MVTPDWCIIYSFCTKIISLSTDPVQSMCTGHTTLSLSTDPVQSMCTGHTTLESDLTIHIYRYPVYSYYSEILDILLENDLGSFVGVSLGRQDPHW